MTQEPAGTTAARLTECVGGGGVAVFPSDTVYGVCCDPGDQQAASRLYALKGRPASSACAVMFFSLDHALQLLDDLLDTEREALHLLLPGPVTVLLANRRRRFAPACPLDPDTIGLRVPALSGPAAVLGAVAVPVMQSSANLSGQPDARRLTDVPAALRDGADLVIDGGELPGTPSTVVDLRELDSDRRWYVLREGALAREAIDRALSTLL